MYIFSPAKIGNNVSRQLLQHFEVDYPASSVL